MNPSNLIPEIITQMLDKKLKTLEVEYLDTLGALQSAIAKTKREAREREDAATIEKLKGQIV